MQKLTEDFLRASLKLVPVATREKIAKDMKFYSDDLYREILKIIYELGDAVATHPSGLAPEQPRKEKRTEEPHITVQNIFPKDLTITVRVIEFPEVKVQQEDE